MTNTLRGIPPGYRFDPTDVELIECYLRRKINDENPPCDLVRDIEVYATSPDHIAEELKPRRGEAMYMFSSRDKKHSKGTRPNRVIACGDGYWRQSGNTDIYDRNDVHVGTHTNLVYMIKKKGKKGKGTKSKWLMSEYTIVHPSEWNNLVLCKIYETPRQKKGADGDSQPDVIDDDYVSEDASEPQLNGVKRISSEPSLVEPLDVRCSKIRRVSSDQPMPSYPSQHLASSSMGSGVKISADSFDEVNSIGQEMQMQGSQQEQSCQVPSNGEVNWNNQPILDYDVSFDEVDWKTLYETVGSPSNHDQSSIPQGMQALGYQQEQFNQILSNGEADQIDSWNFGANNILNRGFQQIQDSVTREAQISAHQQQQSYQTLDYAEWENRLNMTTNWVAEMQQ